METLTWLFLESTAALCALLFVALFVLLVLWRRSGNPPDDARHEADPSQNAQTIQDVAPHCTFSTMRATERPDQGKCRKGSTGATFSEPEYTPGSRMEQFCRGLATAPHIR